MIRIELAVRNKGRYNYTKIWSNFMEHVWYNVHNKMYETDARSELLAHYEAKLEPDRHGRVGIIFERESMATAFVLKYENFDGGTDDN
jgi:hypothetical protein